MEKVLTFTNEQKSLIWNRFVQPTNGTQEEANHFNEVCETFGLNHKRFRPVAVFVDFQEYFQANSGELNSRSGNKNVWDRMPSAIIQKIAEVFVLLRQFPLGGLYTREEMSLEENDNGNSGNMDVPMGANPAPIKPDKVAGNQ